MTPRKFLKPVLLLPLVGLVAVLVADAAELMRPSVISAAACTAILLRDKPDAQRLVEQHRNTIADEARRNDLPPELIAAVIYNHQAYLSNFRRYTDCFGSAFGANLSLGLAQLRISTAAELDGLYLEQLSAAQFRRLRAQLLQAELNIAYQARELRALLERESRYPGMTASELIVDPSAMALIITEYRMGRLKTESASSRLTANAFNALRFMQDGRLDLFDRDAADSRRVHAKIREYLSFIYCDSGIFNAGVCEEWTQSLVTGRALD